MSLKKKNIRSKKAAEIKSNTSRNIVGLPLGRPPQFRIEEGMGNQDAD
jgi:hypothetical protein